jgi:hypothetical protein
MPSVKNSEIELRKFRVERGKVETDEAALSRLGKKAVLKVMSPLYVMKIGSDKSTLNVAKIRLCFYSGIQLYSFDHMGRGLDVSYSSTQMPQQRVIIHSLFVIGLHKYVLPPMS